MTSKKQSNSRRILVFLLFFPQQADIPIFRFRPLDLNAACIKKFPKDFRQLFRGFGVYFMPRLTDDHKLAAWYFCQKRKAGNLLLISCSRRRQTVCVAEDFFLKTIKSYISVRLSCSNSFILPSSLAILVCSVFLERKQEILNANSLLEFIKKSHHFFDPIDDKQ